jgi:death-on-curing protein
LLDAEVAMPKASFVGALLHAAIVEMAAACLFHIVQNHPFVDGDM